jgi:hypothetical protein
MIFLCLTCTFLLSVSALGQPVGTLSGRVITRGGKYIGQVGPPGAADAAEVTLKAVRVSDNAAAGNRAMKASTDVEGNFHFERIPPGIYFVEAESRGYLTARSHLVTVRSDEVAIVDLCLTVGSLGFMSWMEISGTILTDQGPAADATVNISSLPLPYTVEQLRTDVNGKYGPIRVRPDDWVITVLKPGYKYETKLVKEGISKVVNFHLKQVEH